MKISYHEGTKSSGTEALIDTALELAAKKWRKAGESTGAEWPSEGFWEIVW